MRWRESCFAAGGSVTTLRLAQITYFVSSQTQQHPILPYPALPYHTKTFYILHVVLLLCGIAMQHCLYAVRHKEALLRSTCACLQQLGAVVLWVTSVSSARTPETLTLGPCTKPRWVRGCAPAAARAWWCPG